MDDAARQIAIEVIRASRGETGSVLVATIIAAPDGIEPVAGTKMMLRADGTRIGGFGGAAFEATVIEDCSAILGEFPRRAIQALYYRSDGANIHRLEANGGADAFELMVEIIESSATLLIVGGGHIGLSLATIGAHTGFSVAVVDDREMYANAERFPMADKTLAGDVEALLKEFPIGGTTFIVMVSRGHKVDEMALRAVLGRSAAYVGMIGSRRRVSTVLRHMAEEGFAIEELEAVYTPIGFDIGAETPEEIAVSIIAEIISVRRGGTGRQMKDSRPPIRPGVAEPINAD
jgi:xanthine dehydrogenase accessory factor